MNLNEFERNNGAGNSYTGEETAFSFVANEAQALKQKIEKRKIKQRKLRVIIGGVALLILLLIGAFGYSQYKLYKLSQEEKTTTSEAEKVAPKTGEEVIKALSRHILIPEGTPQIAEVQDVDKLKDKQAFFKNAKNGDIVIVYETTIFIYRPGDDIVIAAGDISGVGQTNP